MFIVSTMYITYKYKVQCRYSISSKHVVFIKIKTDERYSKRV